MRGCHSLFLLTLSVCSTGWSKEPFSVFGFGTVSCKVLVDTEAESSPMKPLSKDLFAWSQGWLSARNYVGHEDKPLTVGGSLSARTLESMIVDECKEHPDFPIFMALDLLYDRLQKKGL